jgi:hypothetical protein
LHQAFSRILLNPANETALPQNLLNKRCERGLCLDSMRRQTFITHPQGLQAIAHEATTSRLELQIMPERCAMQKTLHHRIDVASVAKVWKASDQVPRQQRRRCFTQLTQHWAGKSQNSSFANGLQLPQRCAPLHDLFEMSLSVTNIGPNWIQLHFNGGEVSHSLVL